MNFISHCVSGFLEMNSSQFCFTCARIKTTIMNLLFIVRQDWIKHVLLGCGQGFCLWWLIFQICFKIGNESLKYAYEDLPTRIRLNLLLSSQIAMLGELLWVGSNKFYLVSNYWVTRESVTTRVPWNKVRCLVANALYQVELPFNVFVLFCNFINYHWDLFHGGKLLECSVN